MTDELINALAREYAEEVAKEVADLPNCLKNESIDLIAEDMERKLQWLSRRFYLADKEKAKAFYRGETFGELDFIELVSSRRILTSLFPEIAKEVKNGLV